MKPYFGIIFSLSILTALIIVLTGCVALSPQGQAEASSRNVSPSSDAAHISYPIVATSQTNCYDNANEISCPGKGQAFYGQDAQFQDFAPGYIISSDGLTVYDTITRLTWQRSPDMNGNAIIYSDKLTWAQAEDLPAQLNAMKYGGYSDWRLPTVKELYSLINFQGTDPSPTSTSTAGLTPFIDTSVFGFSYGFTNNNERVIDSQWATSTTYVANPDVVFGVNFADGRIKAYPTRWQPTSPTGTAGTKTFFVICVRGNPDYGKNEFHDNGDGTVTDAATGLMWSKNDSGSGMNWEDALAWVHEKNAENYLGYSDWRLPNAKELQSIVDYTRSPDTTGSAAIDPVFSTTQITNEAGQPDYPYYWTSTTHISANGNAGGEAVYVAFGRALGYLNGRWIDVHGAGAQRADPKTGSAADYPDGRGPQNDAVRIDNYVRLVRGGGVSTGPAGEVSPSAQVSPAPGPVMQGSYGPQGQGTPPEPPAAAVQACSGQSEGSTCSFTGPRRTVQGTCQPVGPDSRMACVPASGPPTHQGSP